MAVGTLNALPHYTQKAIEKASHLSNLLSMPKLPPAMGPEAAVTSFAKATGPCREFIRKNAGNKDQYLKAIEKVCYNKLNWNGSRGTEGNFSRIREEKGDFMGIMNKYLLGFYDYTVILTYAGTLTAFHGILALMNGRPRQAILCLMVAGFCDMFDGAVASTKKRNRHEKQFGIQIDSLNDIVAFGIFPALFVYTMAPESHFSVMAASTYLLCALIRLAYFNVMEEERQDACDQGRTEYMGLPVTTAALALPAIYELHSLMPGLTFHVYGTLLFVMAVLFISPIRIRKPQRIGKLGMLAVGTVLLLGMMAGGWRV